MRAKPKILSSFEEEKEPLGWLSHIGEYFD